MIMIIMWSDYIDDNYNDYDNNKDDDKDDVDDEGLGFRMMILYDDKYNGDGNGNYKYEDNYDMWNVRKIILVHTHDDLFR